MSAKEEKLQLPLSALHIFLLFLDTTLANTKVPFLCVCVNYLTRSLCSLVEETT